MRSESSFATATEDKRETRERRERARENASERGRFLAFQNDREKDFSRGAAAFGLAFAFQNASPIPLSPAPRGNASEAPKSRLNCASPLGAGVAF